MLRTSLKRLRLFREENGKLPLLVRAVDEYVLAPSSEPRPKPVAYFFRWWSPLCLRQIQQGSQLPPCPPTPHGERWRRLAPEHSWEAPPCQPSPSCSSASLSLSLSSPMYTCTHIPMVSATFFSPAMHKFSKDFVRCYKTESLHTFSGRADRHLKCREGFENVWRGNETSLQLKILSPSLSLSLLFRVDIAAWSSIPQCTSFGSPAMPTFSGRGDRHTSSVWKDWIMYRDVTEQPHFY